MDFICGEAGLLVARSPGAKVGKEKSTARGGHTVQSVSHLLEVSEEAANTGCLLVVYPH